MNPHNLDNWRAQIRKGYLDLAILLLIQSKKRLYGLEMLMLIQQMGLDIKEGTLYPILSRMTTDNLLATEWETQNLSGHPRKFYTMTESGVFAIQEMSQEFKRLVKIFSNLERKNNL